jgi:hypothetical protein
MSNLVFLLTVALQCLHTIFVNSATIYFVVCYQSLFKNSFKMVKIYNYIKFLFHLVRGVVDLSERYTLPRLFIFLAARLFYMQARCYVICNL